MVEELDDPKWKAWGTKFDSENVISNFEENYFFPQETAYKNVCREITSAAGL